MMREFLLRPVTMPAWVWLSLIVVLWAGIILKLYDYIVYERPLDRCIEQRKTHCVIDGKDVFIQYRELQDTGYIA